MVVGLISKYNISMHINGHITKIFDRLIKKENFVIIDIGDFFINKGTIQNFLMSKFNIIPKYYITFNNIGAHADIIEELSHILKIICIVDDIHHLKSVRNPRIKVFQNSHYILNTYAYVYNFYKFPISNNNIFFPHSARYLAKFNNKPINKILISGTIIKNIYQDRYYLSQLAKNDNRLHILNITQNIIGKKYYNTLGKYISCFVDDSRFYILAKFFEIPASGSLLFAMNINTKHIFSQLGFIDGVNYISCDRNNVIEKIKYITNPNNLHIINKIRKNGHNLIKYNHMWKHRYDYILKLLSSKDLYQNNISNQFDTSYKIIINDS